VVNQYYAGLLYKNEIPEKLHPGQLLKAYVKPITFTDKSDPMLIRKEFGISKKLFKKALGNLYKQKKVLLKPDGIYKL